MMNFSPEFLGKVLDTLLPGLPATERAEALPAASQIGVDLSLAGHLAHHPARARLAEVLGWIAEEAGGEEAFIAADEKMAISYIQRVEEKDNAAFQALLFTVTADYYEAEDVLLAFGWPGHPPQPKGYSLPAFDEGLLEPVKQKRLLWRSA